MRLGFLMLRHPAGRMCPVMPEVLALLQQWGAEVDVIYPEDQVVDLAKVRVEHDLYILRSKSDLAFNFAGALHAAGAAILNPYPVSTLMRDKAATFRILRTAGVPAPETFLASRREHLVSLLEDGPIVLKPYHGSAGHAARIVWDAGELDDTPEEPPILVQRYYEPDGPDRKVYSIGAQTFGVIRRFPSRSYLERLGTPFTPTGEILDIASRCGHAFGIDVYGIDVIECDGRPYVVDISAFPAFTGVPDGALRLADYVFAAAERVLRGNPLLPSTNGSQAVA